MNPTSMFTDPAMQQQMQQMMLASALLSAGGQNSTPEGANFGNAMMRGIGGAAGMARQNTELQLMQQHRELQQKQMAMALAEAKRKAEAQMRIRSIMQGVDPNMAARISQGGPFNQQQIDPQQQQRMMMAEIAGLGSDGGPAASMFNAANQVHNVGEGQTAINPMGQVLAQGNPKWHAAQPGATLYKNTPAGPEIGATMPGMDATERFLMGLAATNQRFNEGQQFTREQTQERYGRDDEKDDEAVLSSVSQFTRVNQFGMPQEIPDLDARTAARPLRSPKYATPENRARQAITTLPPQVRSQLIGGAPVSSKSGGAAVSGAVGTVVTSPDGTEFVRHIPPSGPPVLMFRPKGAKDWKRFSEY